MTILSRIEEYGNNTTDGDYIVLSFNTKYRRIWQCQFTGDGMCQFSGEAAFESLKGEEQKQIRQIGAIVFYLTFDNIPEDLTV